MSKPTGRPRGRPRKPDSELLNPRRTRERRTPDDKRADENERMAAVSASVDSERESEEILVSGKAEETTEAPEYVCNSCQVRIRHGQPRCGGCGENLDWSGVNAQNN